MLTIPITKSVRGYHSVTAGYMSASRQASSRHLSLRLRSVGTQIDEDYLLSVPAKTNSSQPDWCRCTPAIFRHLKHVSNNQLPPVHKVLLHAPAGRTRHQVGSHPRVGPVTMEAFYDLYDSFITVADPELLQRLRVVPKPHVYERGDLVSIDVVHHRLTRGLVTHKRWGPHDLTLPPQSISY